MWSYWKLPRKEQHRRYKEDIKPFTGGCWLSVSLRMGENSFEDSTWRMSVSSKGRGHSRGHWRAAATWTLFFQYEVTIPGYDGRNHGGREFCFCCMACKEKVFLCKVAFLGLISCFLNTMFKIIFMWRNLSCFLIASGWFLNIDFLLTHQISVCCIRLRNS